MWDALNEIADRESTSINQICTWVDGHRAETGFTSSLRIIILIYFRRAARGDASDFARTPEVHPSL